MQFKITLIAALILSIYLTACNVGSGGFTYPYDGTWTASYNNAADFPAEGAGEKVVCTKPEVTLTILKGIGSTKQTLSCIVTTTVTVIGGADKVTAVTKYLDYFISVSIGETGITNVIVNGFPLDGKCISTVGCAAQSSSTALSLTR